MFTTPSILRRFIGLIVLALLASSSVKAAHIVGGEMYYDYLGNDQYRFTLKMYRDCNVSGTGVANFFDAQANITIFRGTTYMDKLQTDLVSETSIPAVLNEPCVDPPTGICVKQGLYQFTLTLPYTPEGYTIVHQRCCRNTTINNIVNPGSTGGSFYINLTAEALQAHNSSPRFRYFPPIVICNHISIDFDHSATDPNGNTLRYSLCAPEEGGGDDRQNGNATYGVTPYPASNPPYTDVTYVNGYSGANPMGGSPQIVIDSLTGRITGRPNVLGRFVVAVCVSEYDAAGHLLGILRRDFQFNVLDCTINVYADIAATGVVAGSQTILLRECKDTTSIHFINQSGLASNIHGYRWEFNLGNGQVDTSNAVNPTELFPNYGTYQVLLIANPYSNGCRDSASIQVEIYPPLTADFSYTTLPCVYDTIPFTDLSHSQGGAPVTNWSWSFHDGSTSTQRNPRHLFVQAGDYPVQLIAQDANHCQDTVVHSIAWYPAPRLAFDFPDTTACEPAQLTFVNHSLPVNGYQIQWDFGDGSGNSVAYSPTHTYAAGDYNVSLTITSPTGCASDTTVNGLIHIKQTPKANFSYSPTELTIFDPTATFTDMSTGTISSLLWSFGNGDHTSIRNPTYTFPDSGVYRVQLRVVSPNGCADSLIIPVDVVPKYTYFLPNAFTPDGDAINDVFIGKGYTHAINGFDFSIWNRWGECVFKTQNPEEGWNGLKNNTGQACEAGVYVYSVKIKGPRGKNEDHQGVVVLVR